MRIYPADDEEKIRAQALVREWQESGFLEKSELPQLEADLRVDLRRTNVFFRAVLFLFTAIIVGAFMALIVTVLDLRHEIPGATLCILGALASWQIAEFLIRRFRLYRFGVEEAFVAASVAMLGLAVSLVSATFEVGIYSRFPAQAGLIAAALAALAVYRRYGYRYAAIASMMCAGGAVFQLDLSEPRERLLIAAIFGLVCFLAGPGFVSTTAWAGIYLALNLQFQLGVAPRASFYWFTYLIIWIMPLAGLAVGLRRKDRWFTDASAAMFLATIATNRPYLGLPRHPWDPILFGAFLIVSAVLIRRWLSSGPEGRRYGFTAIRLLASDRRVLTVAGTASVVLHPAPAPGSAGPAAPAAPKPEFQGGRSGGAGASGSF